MSRICLYWVMRALIPLTANNPVAAGSKCRRQSLGTAAGNRMLDHPAFQQPHEHGDDYATWLIQQKASHLVGHFGLTKSDREDIEQELMLDLLQRWPNFDPQRARPCTFISKVVENAIIAIINRRRAVGRDYRRTRNAVPKRVLEEELASRSGGRNHEINLRLDFETVLDRLLPEHRELCERLKTQSILAASREMHVPESTLRGWLKKVREVFEAAGFDHSL